METAVEFKHVTKAFGEVQAVREILSLIHI